MKKLLVLLSVTSLLFLTTSLEAKKTPLDNLLKHLDTSFALIQEHPGYSASESYHRNKALAPVYAEIYNLYDNQGDYVLTMSDKKKLLNFFASSVQKYPDPDATPEVIAKRTAALESAVTLKDVIEEYIDLKFFRPQIEEYSGYKFEFPGYFSVFSKEYSRGYSYGKSFQMQDRFPSPGSNYLYISVFSELQYTIDEDYFIEVVNEVFEDINYDGHHIITDSSRVYSDDNYAYKNFEGNCDDGNHFIGTVASFYTERGHVITVIAYGLDEECFEDFWSIVEPYASLLDLY